jgi:hypothetical protein
MACSSHGASGNEREKRAVENQDSLLQCEHCKGLPGGPVICLQVPSVLHRAFRKIALWDIDEPSRNVNGMIQAWTEGSGI